MHRWLPTLLIVISVRPVTAQTSAPPPEQINPTQEVAGEAPSGPAIAAGPTEIRIGGYIGITGIYRSTSSGGGPATSFGAIPYDDVLQGNTSEARLSAQASRLSIRVNAAPVPDRSTLAGYFEMDFAGTVPGNAAVTVGGFELRLRHAFGEAQFHNRFLVAAGQAYSLMTPATEQLSIWPSDYELSTAVDLNYLVGTVWDRVPQVRFTYRSSPAFNWAVSVENPEQQIGSAVTLPACCTADLQAQYNIGTNGLAVPNFMPDVVSRVAFNAGHVFHLDAGGVFRVFRNTLKPYDVATHQTGGGISINARVRTGATKWLGQVAYGPGIGRYLGGLAPDVTFGAAGSISLVRAGSWVGGIEQSVSPAVVIAVYDSGMHADASYTTDVSGALIGYGYPGSANSNNRNIHEVTGVFSWRPWAIAGRGSMQWNTQLSWLQRTPWSVGNGPASADAWLFLTQIRYNLP